MSGREPTILVVEDDEAILTALDRGLRLEGYAVHTARDGGAALAAVAEVEPDLVVLDLGLPDLDGIDLTRRLRGDGYGFPICILTARSAVDQRVAGLQAGADDYMVKPFALEELVARLEALQRRAPADQPAAFEVLDLRVDPRRRRAWRGGEELALTRREFDLLEALARNAGIVLTRDQLLTLVWGYDFEVESNVLDVFVSSLRRKLEAGGRTRLLHTVRGTGFSLRPD